MSYLLPRLSSVDAQKLWETVRTAETQGQLAELIRFEHPRAVPSPSGGSVVTPDQLREVRECVLRDLGEGHGDVLDGALLGRSLAENLNVVRSDGAHMGGWAFLSLCVFPDVVARRWPGLPEDRAIGMMRGRNYLRTVWHRWWLLGDLLLQGSPPLGEDELVQIAERSALARNRPLARVLAEEILSHTAGRRSAFARVLAKRAQYWTGPTVLDLWTEDELRNRVAGLGAELRGGA